MAKNKSKSKVRIDFQTVSSLDKTPLNRDKQQKRSKAQSSPDSINFSSDKRPVPPDAYSAMMAQAHDLTMASQMSSPPPSQSILPQIPPYVGANGQIYSPIQSTINPQYPSGVANPGQPYAMPCNNNTQQHISSGYQPSQVTQAPSQSQQFGNFNFQQFVVDKLEALDRRLNKLDIIENQMSSLSQKLSNMDGRVSSFEGTH